MQTILFEIHFFFIERNSIQRDKGSKSTVHGHKPDFNQRGVRVLMFKANGPGWGNLYVADLLSESSMSYCISLKQL